MHKIDYQGWGLGHQINIIMVQERLTVSFLQFLIDDMCANFTIEVMSELVTRRLSQGSCTIDDLGLEVAGSDRSLDIASAQILANAAVESLIKIDDVVMIDDQVSLRKSVSPV